LKYDILIKCKRIGRIVGGNSMYNLLLVDDEASTREALSSYFPWEDLGFHIAGQANNGKEALEFLQHTKVEVVLTDIQMPIMNGIELAKTLYDQNSDIHVVFISSYREFEYAQKALELKVRNYILKPAKYHVLQEVFQRLYTELSSSNTEEAKAPSEHLIIQKIKDYVKLNYKTATLEEVATYVYLNPNYASQLFKKKTDTNFSDYLIKIKMQEALKLLKTNQFKTYEISEMVGYANPKNFTRTFKSFYGYPPSHVKRGDGHV